MTHPNDPFAFTRGNPKGSVLIVGEAWGVNEADAKVPFVGASGKELERMLREGGIPLSECLFANVVDLRPQGNEMKTLLIPTKEARERKLESTWGLFPSETILKGIDKLRRLIEALRPKLIIALGNWPLWALTQKGSIKDDKGYKIPTGIDAYRGSMLTLVCSGAEIPVLPTYHPAGVLRQWKWRHITVRDFQRAAAFLSGNLPWKDMREFKWLIQPTVRETRAWVDNFLETNSGPLNLILDLETFAGQIHIFGVKNPYNGTCLCVPFMHVTGLSKAGNTYTLRPTYSVHEFTAIAFHLKRLLDSPRVSLVGQNLIYDIQYLAYYFGYSPRVGDDTMIIAHVLSPGERKGLDFLASVYCRYYSYWKEDRKVSLANESTELGCRYNCLDLEYTEEVWQAERSLIDRFGKTEQYAKRIRLLHQLFRMMQRGIRIDTQQRRMQRTYMELMIQQIEEWLDGAMPDALKPERHKTKTGKWKTAAWYSSDTQLKRVLYDTLHLKPVWDPETGRPTLDKEALKTLSNRYPELKPFFNMLALLRSAYTYKKTFYDASIDADGRMRCAYNPAGPITFRLSSSENVFGRGHNLTNVPRDRQVLNFFNVIENLA